MGIANKELLVTIDSTNIFNSSDSTNTSLAEAVNKFIDKFPSMFNAHIGSWYDPESVLDVSDNDEETPEPAVIYDASKNYMSSFEEWVQYDNNGTLVTTNPFRSATLTGWAPFSILSIPAWASFGTIASSFTESSALYSRGTSTVPGTV